jgi:hypothetical protein
MAFGIDCRILCTALGSSGRSDWLLRCLDVRLYEDWERSLPLQSDGKEQSDSDHKGHWTLQSGTDHKGRLTLQSDSDIKEHWTLQSDSEHRDYWTLQSDSDQHITQHAMLLVCVLKVSVLSAAELPVRMLSTVRMWNTGVLQVVVKCTKLHEIKFDTNVR